MIKRIRIKMARISFWWHMEMALAYGELIKEGKISDAFAFRPMTKHFIKMTKALTVLASEGYYSPEQIKGFEEIYERHLNITV